MPITPFRRRVDAVLLDTHRKATAARSGEAVDKWEALRTLAAARTEYGLSDRDLSVLQALVSFHPSAILGGGAGDPVVFPSNRTLCERLNGMACSTMRRHLGKLVSAGVILRRDSPNGKRYARRFGAEKIAFGFDLSPLQNRLPEFRDASARLAAEAEALERLRQTVSLMRRDAAELAAYGPTVRPAPLWAELAALAADAAKLLRRKPETTFLRALERRLATALARAAALLDPSRTEETSTSAAPDEQHIEPQDKIQIDPQPRPVDPPREDAGTGFAGNPKKPEANPRTAPPAPPIVSLGDVLAASPGMETYCRDPIRDWHDLVRASEAIRPMLGIPQATWNTARSVIGEIGAAICIAAILKRFASIRSHGAYLARLCVNASKGELCLEQMVISLLPDGKRAGSQL
ncbi:plasmid replication protein RepC [Mangrovicoccus sp. HB161399]|uniref:plasmid replication protein RepC n=1 Tax=Mangrovicoccus sp. HB161399 TaxID=2720392 RepID=UPI0020A63102|nr:plasmid replication protein RepC [Mangrovicoccus sp. HB161399]